MGIISLTEKLLVMAATLIVVIGMILLIDEWRNARLYAFFFTGQWENLVYLLAFAFSLGYLLKKLAQWQFHELFVTNRGKRGRPR
ncbi:MAG: hypothetical protein Q7R47_03370 [Candidatus Diapherotrites archaeon]|nr:hypothetical protein [Candidatus Diapherotrites archaeon]